MTSSFYLCLMVALLLVSTAVAVEKEAAEQKTVHTNTGDVATEKSPEEDEESWSSWAKEKVSGSLGLKHQPQEDTSGGMGKYAADKTETTKEKLQEAAEKAKEKAEEATSGAAHFTAEKGAETKEAAVEKAGQAKETAGKGKEGYEPTTSEAEEIVKERAPGRTREEEL